MYKDVLRFWIEEHNLGSTFVTGFSKSMAQGFRWNDDGP